MVRTDFGVIDLSFPYPFGVYIMARFTIDFRLGDYHITLDGSRCQVFSLEVQCIIYNGPIDNLADEGYLDIFVYLIEGGYIKAV